MRRRQKPTQRDVRLFLHAMARNEDEDDRIEELYDEKGEKGKGAERKGSQHPQRRNVQLRLF